MARPRIYKTQGVVLRQMPLGEADRILTLFTPDMGKLRAVARGVRRTKSRLGGHLEPLTHVSVSVAHGKALDTIAEAETIHSFRGLREDLGRVSRAIYVAELVDGFSAEHSPSPNVYRLLLEALHRLQESSGSGQLIRYFEVQLLRQSGFGPELLRCVECRSDIEPGDHLFSSAKGGVLCQRCRPPSGEALLPLSLNGMKVLRYLQREEYAKAATLTVPQALEDELERVLGTYTRYVLDRELKSADFMHLVTPGRSRRATGARRG
jgi:DNA repair protein RecO (recombination protein O)